MPGLSSFLTESVSQSRLSVHFHVKSGSSDFKRNFKAITSTQHRAMESANGGGVGNKLFNCRNWIQKAGLKLGGT